MNIKKEDGSKEHLEMVGKLKSNQNYIALHDDISEILFNIDPMSINFEENLEEYNAPARSILFHLNDCRSADDVLNVLVHEFEHWFSGSAEKTNLLYNKVSEGIWDKYQEYDKKGLL